MRLDAFRKIWLQTTMFCKFTVLSSFLSIIAHVREVESGGLRWENCGEGFHGVNGMKQEKWGLSEGSL
jgi:hypothetical protein